ncbi:hypothetical protein GQ53DRAFT_189233 [Thozetella sp. PMI_491]|nr:hypothetical protein GQ53DRAFT_189233 [Thozetella sp. PMI_491]
MVGGVPTSAFGMVLIRAESTGLWSYVRRQKQANNSMGILLWWRTCGRCVAPGLLPLPPLLPTRHHLGATMSPGGGPQVPVAGAAEGERQTEGCGSETCYAWQRGSAPNRSTLGESCLMDREAWRRRGAVVICRKKPSSGHGRYGCLFRIDS